MPYAWLKNVSTYNYGRTCGPVECVMKYSEYFNVLQIYILLKTIGEPGI